MKSLGLFRLILAVGVVFAIVSLGSSLAGALTLSSGRDCDDNAVLRCGALTTGELQSKYHGTGVVGIFNHFGISGQDINNIGSTAVAGQVTKSGNVMVNGQVVATNAITAGRQNMPGSTLVMAGGVKFYQRPPSVSFASSSLPSFVVMKNNQFAFAIIASCGNPVAATPVAKPAPTPAPVSRTTPPPVSPIPPTPPPKVKAAVTPPPTPQPLPKTGPGDAMTIGIAATVLGTAGHYLYRRQRLSY
jgi:hypothetical protein